MLLFQCTKDACEALTFTRKGVTESWVDNQPAPAGSAQWAWQLHAVKIDRKLVLVAMHVQTRFAMVFWGLKKGDGETLIRLFFERLANHLFWLAGDCGALDEAGCTAMLDRLIDAHRAFGFHAGSDRSVQTHINEVVHSCRYAVEDNGCLPDNQEEAAGFDMHVNQTLRSVRGGDYFQPSDELLCACLRDFAGFDETQLATVRQRLKAAKRHKMADMLLEHAELLNPQQGDAAQALIEQLLAQAASGKSTLH